MKTANFFQYFVLVAFSLATAFVFSSCEKDDHDPPGNNGGNGNGGDTIVAVTDITLNQTTLEFWVGWSQTLTATILPENATDKTVTWTSSDTTVAIVDSNGRITAIAAGTVTITAQAGEQTATCEITIRAVPADGVLINNIIWATRNVDAPGTFTTNPEDAGMFYQWNRNVGWSATDPMVNSDGETTWDSTIPSGTTWERANDPSPAGWRVPNREEIQSLLDRNRVSSEWTTQNGVNGRRFTCLTTNNTVFFPAAGIRHSIAGTLDGVGVTGDYWSNTQVDNSSAWRLWFASGIVNGNGSGNSRNLGYSVRSVME